MTVTRFALLSVLALPLAACGGVTGGAGRAGPITAGMRPATDAHRIAGAEAIMGRDATALTRLFGQPRLDVMEGAGRKLQFASDRCVLDAYLYVPRAGAPAVVTHVDTRNPDGADVDRAACIAALQRR